MTAYQSFRNSWPLRVSLGLAIAACLSACSGFRTSLDMESFGLYKPEVVQGNFVSREQRQALRLGMARAQVKDILGTPLVSSLFHADRWDYVFTIRRQGVAPQSFRLTVQFKADALSQIDGDELPSENEFVQRLVGDKKSVHRRCCKPPRTICANTRLRKRPTLFLSRRPHLCPAATHRLSLLHAEARRDAALRTHPGPGFYLFLKT